MNQPTRGTGPGPRSPVRRRTNRLLDTLLTIAAMAGVIALGCMIASALFGLSLITFSTGSMSPTIPAGSLALVREVPASELRPGQIVTLERAGGRIPITHRIVTIDSAPDGTEAGARSIELRGDANPVADVTPYVVTSGLLVLWAAPGGARIATVVAHPITIGIVSMICTAFVLWAFWPRAFVASKRVTSLS